MRGTSDAEKKAQKAQIGELQFKLDQALAGNDQQLEAMRSRVISLQHEGKAAESAAQNQSQQLKLAQTARAAISGQLESAKREMLSAESYHRTACAELETSLKDQAAKALQAVSSSYKDELEAAQ